MVLMKFADLVKEAAAILEADAETEDGTDFILELELESEVDQIIYVWEDETELEGIEKERYVTLEVDVGIYNDKVDAYELLKESGDFVLCRLYVDPEEDDTISVQASLPLSIATPKILAAAILEAATEADRLEDFVPEAD